MSISKIKESAKGLCVDFEFRRKIPNSGKPFVRYKREYLDSELTKIKQNQQIQLLYAIFLEKCEEEFKLEKPNNPDSLTLAEFIDEYLLYLKNNFSIGYYEEAVILSKVIKEKIGNVKLKELTPIIIQKFYNDVSNVKKEVITALPNKGFVELISTKRYKSKEMEKAYTSHYKCLSKAKRAEEVPIEWAIRFSEFIEIPFDKLFKKIVKEKEYSYCYKKKHMTFLKSCLSEAKKKLLVDENYAKSDFTTFMKNPEPNKSKKILDKKDFFKLYDYILNLSDSQKKAMFVLLLNTGARKEEVLGLKWEYINFENKTIEFKTTITKASGHGIVINENKTKNSSSNRIIAISDEVINVLYEYKKIYDEDYKDKTFLFLNKKGEIIYPGTINKWLDNLLKELNMEHYTVHSLRHAYASLMINYMPLANVSKRIGHSQISTTLNIYTHQINKQDKIDDLKSIIEKNENHDILKALNFLKEKNILSLKEFNDKLKSVV